MILHKIVVVLVLYSTHAECGYTITTPRRWTVDQPSQICVTLTKPSTGNDQFTVVFKTMPEPWQKTDVNEVVVSTQKSYVVPTGMQSVCYEHVIPKTIGENGIGIFIKGSLLGQNVSHANRVSLVTETEKTFIQTDKYLYKPGQNVQFRILSLKGPLLSVSTEDLAEIWVENPSSSRIHQWKNISNPDGLLHRSFALSEEPDQGEYKVQVQISTGMIFSTTFKVEDYVLPRYDITVTPPSYILGVSIEAIFKVCAKYTFGQPVKGLLTFVIDNGGWSKYKMNVNKTMNISGCTDVPILMNDLQINAQGFHAFSLNVKAIVIENGTDVKLESDAITVPIERTVITFKDVGNQKYRKPGIPFVEEVLASLPDGSPAVNEPMSVCIVGNNNTCKIMRTNSNGILKYALPPYTAEQISISSVNHKRVNADAWFRSIMFASTMHRTHQTYHSPSNSSLIIAMDQETVECLPGKSIGINFLIRYASSGQGKAIVYVQVISRGLIQYFNSSTEDLSVSNDIHVPEDIFVKSMKTTTDNLIRGSFNIPVILPSSISPKAEVLIWYEREDKEVVSDHRTIDITSCLPNEVNLQWSTNLASPGDEASLTIESEPMSLCSLGVVDKSVELLSSTHNSLTANVLLKLAESSSVRDGEFDQVDEFRYCQSIRENITATRKKRSIIRRPDSTVVDAIKMFSEAGVFVFSDLTLETRPCQAFPTVYYDSPSSINEGVPMMAFGVPGRPVVYKTANRIIGAAYQNSEPSSAPRVYFPETWLWNIIKVENGSVELPLVLPDTVTEWIGRAVCVHPTKGVGLSDAASVTTFKDFFVDLTLPATAKRGETFPVKISLFNYLKEQLPVNIVLMESPDYDILTENKDEIGSGLRSACVDPEGKTVFSIRIKPKLVGQMNMTVDAIIDINSVQCGGANLAERRDIVVKPVTVDYEGFPKEKTWNDYVCTEENTEGEPAVWEMVAPTDIVEDSARGWLTAVGDLMGPTMDNLGHLVKMPYGCGEQNMLNFAPNIFVLQYLEAANETTEELAANAILYMEKGYQRELNYRHSDGSFSAFGSSDKSGSTWLTAFVLKSFHKAQQFINIDSTDLTITADWLRSKQLENGCFESVGKVIHKDMKGGLEDGGSPSLLSTYVLLSLLEAGEDPNSPIVREAQFCLNADPTTDPYALAVRLYALALAKSPEALPTAEALLSLATKENGVTSWDVGNDAKKSKSLAVEIASYAILGLLNLDDRPYAGLVNEIVRWINQQRNSQGGFISTQDTILALQALALYESTISSKDPDATVMYSSANHEEAFQINNGNKLLLQKTKLPSIPANVTVDVFGKGCVLVQGVLRYNVQDGDASKAFNLSVSAITPFDVSCKTKEITVCVSYLLPDLTSNMAIIEVTLVSGYIPDKKDLKQIVGFGSGLFKRYEVDGSSVLFYLDEIPAADVCAKFNIIREIDVENVKPGTVKVYDYYKPENAISQKYVLPGNEECSRTIPEMISDNGIPVKLDDTSLP